MTPKPVKVRSDLELTCYSYEGINGIKSALRAGEATSTEQVPLKIRLVAPPLYVMTTTSTDKNAAIEVMEKALERIGEEIEKYDGSMNVAMRVSILLVGIAAVTPYWYDCTSLFQPKAVTETDDDALAKLMADAERANAQVSGDDDSEADDE
jgi:translation initiation factor 2 subunit 1